MTYNGLIIAPLVLTIVVCAALSLYVGYRSRLKVKWLFILMAGEVAFLSATFMLELASPTLSGKLFWNDLEYIVNVTLAPLFFLFTVTFLGRGYLVSPRNIFLLMIVPTICLLVLWTNDYHHLFYISVGLEGAEGLASFSLRYGIFFFIHTFYALGLLTATTMLVVSSYIRLSRMHRRQVAILLAAISLPVLSLAVGYSGIVDLSVTYFTVIGFIGTGMLVFVGVFQYELFDIVPLAVDAVVEGMSDGAVVIDATDHIVHANPSAQRLLGMGTKELFALSPWALPLGLDREAMARGGTVTRSMPEAGGRERTVDIHINRLTDRAGAVIGHLLVLHDITEERMMRESLKMANVKLNLLSSITRHDALNEVAVINSSSELLRDRLADEEAKRHAERIHEAAARIQQHLVFAKEYQSLGIRPPSWLSIADAFREAASLVKAEGVDIRSDLDEVEVFADPMLGRVLAVLIDNSIKHGKKVSRIRATCREDRGNLVIIYEDDGIGIPPESKGRIFEQGFGSHHGMGLFIAAQVLLVGDMSIRETGEHGKGARFEITVPPHRWRRTARSPSDRP